MTNRWSRVLGALSLAVSAVALSACSVGTSVCPPPPASSGRLDPVFAESVRAAAVRPAGGGGLSDGCTYVVSTPVRVYRLFSASRPDQAKGNWWSFDHPYGTVDEYRARFAVCPAWNDLDRMVSCEIAAGAVVAIGPGQSAKCDDRTTLVQSKATQLYLPNPGDSTLLRCSDPVAWP